ncbi:hypothetical protein V6N12_047305 [Hibiscus sabdariffa]|uniref:Uncharacterized protein n=1 Tax=Hibiscus sabdariffa TaxID=183260 RepID=A0ABR2DAH6_9ROSI
MDFLIKAGYKNGKGYALFSSTLHSWHTVSSTGTEVNSLPQNLKAETVKLGGGLGIGEAIDKERSKLWIRWNITS